MAHLEVLNLETLNALELGHGSHGDRSDGVCLMEAVSWFADEQHSDRPKCACPVLTSFGISLNDRFSAEERQLLKPLIPKLVGTRATPEIQTRRAYFLADKSVRVFAPMALRAAAGVQKKEEHKEALNKQAGILESLGEIVDRASAEIAKVAARAARTAAYAAYAAAAAAGADAAYAAAAAAYAAYAAYAAAADAAAYAAAAAAYAAYAAKGKPLAKDERLAARAVVVAKAIEVFGEAIEIQ